MATTKWIRIPLLKKLTMQNVWEHPPLDYYRYGEYPRFIRPIVWEEPQYEWYEKSDD